MIDFSVTKPIKYALHLGSYLMVIGGLNVIASNLSEAASRHHNSPEASTTINSQSMGDDFSTSDASLSEESKIIAIINGELLTERDVNNREKLFELTAGLHLSPEVMKNIRPQLIKQLVNERLRTQEMLRRHINIAPEQIADAIADIEKRNNMPPNALRDRLSADGVSLNTLIDQIRLQLGWGQVIQQQLGEQSHITAQEVVQRQNALKREVGQTEFLVNEIFVPVENARHPEQELKFTETIIQQLRNGAPFPIVAAQFSQSQSALQGGSLGWVQEDNLDPEVVNVAKKMPIGAISNPIQVAGGYIIATIGGRRTIGNEMGTLVNIRQVYLPFSSKLDPHNPTQQQVATLNQANKLRTTLHNCADVESANQKAGSGRPSDPGIIQLERLNPEMASLLKGLQIGQLSKPLVSTEGISLIMICSQEKKNLADISASEIANQLLNQRVEQTAQQLERDLHRQAIIQWRNKK